MKLQIIGTGWILGVVLAMASGVAMVAADEQPNGAIEPDARQVLDEMIAAYRGLDAYADEGRFFLSLTVNDEPTTQSTPMALRFARPNKLWLDAGVVRVACDGEHLMNLLMPFRSYLQTPAPETITLGTFDDGAIGSMVLGGPSGPLMTVLLSLIFAEDPVAAILQDADGLKREEDRAVEGETFQTLRIIRPERTDVRLLVDPESRLVRRIETVFDPEELSAKAPAGARVTIEAYGWDAGTITTSAPEDDAFTLERPQGFRRIRSLAEVAAENRPDADNDAR